MNTSVSSAPAPTRNHTEVSSLPVRSSLSLLGACAGLAALAFGPAASASPGGQIHYPDLWPYYAYGLRSDTVNGRQMLSFNAAIANFGDGPMELAPQNNPATGMTDAYQRFYTHDAAGNWTMTGTQYVGTFAFHPEHNHWHFENFAAYQLRTAAPDGTVGPTILASSMKVSFCLGDDWQARTDLEHAAPQTYTDCSQAAVQGISVGWTDIYAWSLPGQSLDVTGLPDGTYWLLITVDPDNLLTEGGGGKGNNTNGTKFQLSNHGKRIRIIRYGF
ncbi:MAG: hypothetical protein HY302_11515 [Opitutae bacterium]|nr:hypothetical protein [Opitutae bacterium]